MDRESGRRRPRIGILINTLHHAYQNATLTGAHRAAVEAGVDLYCLAGGGLLPTDSAARVWQSLFDARTEKANRSRNSLYDLVRGADLDAYVLSSTICHGMTIDELRSYTERFTPSPVAIIGISVAGIPSVLTDDVAGARELTSHLIRFHGRSRIAFVGGPRLSPESQGRFEGFLRAHEENGLSFSPSLKFDGNYLGSSGHEAAARLMEDSRLRCDAIVAANDLMAIGIIEALDARGIRVPEDIAVVGFDDSEQARFTTPALTSVNQQIEAQSTEAVRLVLRALGGEPAPDRTFLPTTLVVRQSCGCLHEHGAPRSIRYVSTRPKTEVIENLRLTIEQSLAQLSLAEVSNHIPDWRSRVIEAFFSDYEGHTASAFEVTFDRLLRESSHLGDVNAWHAVLNVLRDEHSVHVEPGTRKGLEVDRKLHGARRMIGAAAERVQAKRRLEYMNMVHLLELMSAHLRTSFDEASFVQAASERLSAFGVPATYVALQDGAAIAEGGTARLLLATRGTESLLAPAERRHFRSGELVPRDLLTSNRHSMVAEPLFFGDELLGYGLFEMGPEQGFIYEQFREHISTALKGVRLFQQLLGEATLRQKAERDRLENELRLATRIQSGILPKAHAVDGLEIAATMVPATEVGGDYFDILPFKGGAWIGIGDVVGHGLPAGLLMLMLQSLVSATVRASGGATAAEVWSTVNSVFCENIQERLEQDEYATLTLIRYDVSGKLSFAGAHEDLIVCRARTGKCELVATPGTWAGIASQLEAPIQLAELQLEPGDVLVLYTDGMTEGMNAQHVLFGLDRLCAEIETVRTEPARAICGHLMRVVKAHMKEQADDMTVVVARYLGRH